MTPTPELLTRLRKYLNETIPAGGTDTDTRFLNSELEELLTEADNVYQAASKGWIIKASLLQGDIESYSVGQEKYDLTSLKDQLSHAVTMASQYASLGTATAGGKVLSGAILKLSKPEVI
ncbi:hypothetical protein Dtox_4236 [Desulfofarcimen acetoxidans DSM 771]|uniref:Uncharacterized protein n=1 Tax=Desulfofarcimen acetoxidans (strain ATCC 49208 / DSM 771 / KCTC 5769 / VKM B-1644 / 5575) TaxID=485916 RepID=C8VZF8_DESAS|nr:hypothetical protein [Desulfofarcimen acetoxidans]ACV64903.1 hypothetical protein Dtox_4236 [Desulfofarcimen acetoxidans DSM 771]